MDATSGTNTDGGLHNYYDESDWDLPEGFST
ncbi:hypothetical protein Hjap01_00304 [Haloarcula japonica]